jgi:curved DNA-binding protein
MQKKDYYKILQVSQSAETAEIKKAYRRLAKEMHPDLNPDDEQSEERFKEIAEAYDVLSDPDKRSQYDYFIKYGTAPPNTHFKNYRERRDDIFQPVFSTFFNDLFKKQKQKAAKKYMKGNDRKGKLTISLDEVAKGSARILNIDGEKIRIKIWPGIENRRIIKIKEKGHKSKYGGRRGDLYIKIVTETHEIYQRRGSNLFRTFKVNPFEALHGSKKTLETLQGKKEFSIPELSAPGSKIVIKGSGLPIYRLEGEYGDLIIKLEYDMPEKLSDKEKQLLAELLGYQKTSLK